MFEWGAGKARRNLAKHGVEFKEATSVFDDPRALDGEDFLHSASEARRLRLGRSASNRVLVIAYTIRGSAVRMISARLASRKERKHYAEA